MTAARRGRGFVYAMALAAALAAPRFAAAWNAQCTEIWNPHGETIPPAGRTTEPGTAPNSGQNPDGFYQVGAFSLTLPLQTGPVWLLDGCGDGFTGHVYEGNGPGGTFFFGTTVKYTEANGRTPGQQNMATAGKGPPYDGPSDWVEWQLWGQGDLMVCDGTEPLPREIWRHPPWCVCCYVPPPPRDCEPPFTDCPASTGPIAEDPKDFRP